MATVPPQETREQAVASASQTIFTYQFMILREQDIAIYQRAAAQTPDDASQRLTLNVDYTVTGVGIEAGGTFILTTGATAGDILTWQRDSIIERETDFDVAGPLTGAALNFEFDRVVMIEQELETRMAQQMLTYQTSNQLEDQRLENTLPQLAKNSGGDISIWSRAGGGALVALTIASADDVNTLRSELASEANGGDGALLVGYYDSVGGGKTVKARLDEIRVDINDLIVAGSVQFTIVTTAPPGWIFLNGKTIGNASSGATERANADTQDLFTLLWDNVTDAFAPVSGGRGGDATSDFNANKTIQLLNPLGRVFGAAGTPSAIAPAPVLGEDIGLQTATLLKANVPPHVHSHTFSGQAGLDSHGPGITTNLATQVTQNTLDGSADGLASDPFDIIQPCLFLNVLIKL